LLAFMIFISFAALRNYSQTPGFRGFAKLHPESWTPGIGVIP
jgi:hypothetical protein